MLFVARLCGWAVVVLVACGGVVVSGVVVVVVVAAGWRPGCPQCWDYGAPSVLYENPDHATRTSDS